MTEDLLYAGVEGQARALAAGETTSADLLEAVLERIARLDPLLNAFTVVLADQARARAAELDAAAARGEVVGPLHGVPVAIKEEFQVAGTVTTMGGSANRTPESRDGYVARRLREAGALIVGKTNMPEFGQYPFTESESHGTTRNPWAPGRTPGGSSGGTAAAVAGGMVPVGIGGDGGGSIRIPAACCGLFGLKPTRGRVSAWPKADLWGALSTIGPLSRSVLDSALVYDVLRGNEPTDRFRAPEPVSSFTDAARLATAESQRTLRIGWSPKATTKPWKPVAEHVRALEETATLLEGLGHQVEEVDPRYPDPSPAFIPQYFNGVRTDARRVDDPDRLERRTKQLVALGGWVRPGVVAWAERQNERLASVVDERVFSRYDVLLTPVLTHRPPTVGQLAGTSAPTAMVKALPMVAFTGLWNVTGHPAASLPAGFGEDALPLAVQLVGRRGEETTLLALAAQVESLRPWTDRRPDL